MKHSLINSTFPSFFKSLSRAPDDSSIFFITCLTVILFNFYPCHISMVYNFNFIWETGHLSQHKQSHQTRFKIWIILLSSTFGKLIMMVRMYLHFFSSMAEIHIEKWSSHPHHHPFSTWRTRDSTPGSVMFFKFIGMKRRLLYLQSLFVGKGY